MRRQGLRQESSTAKRGGGRRDSTTPMSVKIDQSIGAVEYITWKAVMPLKEEGDATATTGVTTEDEEGDSHN